MGEPPRGFRVLPTTPAEPVDMRAQMGGLPAPCTPRCKPGTIHALDCAYYSGPLSRTGSLSHADPREVAREGDW